MHQVLLVIIPCKRPALADQPQPQKCFWWLRKMVRIAALLLWISQTHSVFGQKEASPNIDTLIERANTSIREGYWQDAKKIGTEVHTLSIERKDKLNQARSAYLLGKAYIKSENFDVASDYFKEGLELADFIGDSVLLSKILIAFGAARINTGDFQEGERNLAQAINLIERTGNEQFLPYAYRYLASSAYNQNDFEKAIKEYSHALSVASGFDDKVSISGLQHNIAQCYVKLEQWNNAATWERKAIKMRIELGHDHYVNHYYSFLVEINSADSNLGDLLEDEITYLGYYNDSAGMNLDQIAIQNQIKLHENIRLLTQKNEGKLKEAQKERLILAVTVSLLLALMAGLFWQWRRNSRILKATRVAQSTQNEVNTVSEEAMQRLTALNRYDEIQHLLSQTSNPLHQSCYEFLTRNYSNAQIGSIIGRDNTTIGRYMGEIAEQIDIDKHRLKEEALEIGRLIWKVHQ